MTFAQYIDNPMGKSNAVFAARDAYKQQYTEKWDALFMRESGRIHYTLYHDDTHDVYLIHLKIPSETVKDFYYDVVIRFYTDDNALRAGASLKDYQAQFFSNDPAFIYTYLYVFHKHKMLVEDLKSKCPTASLRDAPVERNFYETPGYVKSIYFAYIFMSRNSLFLKDYYNHSGRKYSKTALLSAVASGVNKMEERQDKESKQKALEKRKKADSKRIQDRNLRSPTSGDFKGVTRAPTVKTIGMVSRDPKNVKKTKVVGTVRKQKSK